MKESNVLQLDPVFADTLTNLHIATRIGEGDEREKFEAYFQLHPEERGILIDNLTRSLADVSYNIERERHLRVLRVAEVFDDAFLRDSDRQHRVLINGPQALRNDELGHAALSFHLGHWREYFKNHLSDFWVEAADAAMSQAARETGELRMSTDLLIEQILDDAGSDEE